MIAKAHRFHGLGSLKFVFNKGQTVRGKHCALRYHPNKHRQQFRLAVVVSRKVSKSAVVRNRIRRRIYESIRQTLPTNSPSYDLAIIVYSEQLADMPSKELAQEISQLLKKAAIF